MRGGLVARNDDREVVFVEREDGGSSLRWLLVGAVLGAGLAMLFAPRSGKELRRELKGGVRRLRQVANDAIDEIKGEFGEEERSARAMADSGAAYDDDEEEADDEDGEEAGEAGEAERQRPERPERPERPSLRAAREELERRLAAARARRRRSVPDDEEPVA
jgi:gas vesicle protein